MRYGNVCPRLRTVVISPQITPRIHGVPRPLNLPSSDIASTKLILMPTPTDAARPTLNLSLSISNAVERIASEIETGVRVDSLHDSMAQTVSRRNAAKSFGDH